MGTNQPTLRNHRPPAMADTSTPQPNHSLYSPTNPAQPNHSLYSWLCWRRPTTLEEEGMIRVTRVELVELPTGITESAITSSITSTESLPSYEELVNEIGAF